MEATFSEFSYGFALTREITNGKFGSLSGAPVFPSQYREGRSGGYDVQLPVQGIPLFLQFKVSHYLHRSNALEWEKFHCSYYRMYIRPLRHSNQHILLTDLQNQGNAVYYTAPRFHTVSELNEAYSRGDVLGRSAFFPPADISLGNPPDIETHYMAFHPSGKPAFLCSEEPKEVIKSYTGEEVGEIVRNVVKEQKREVNESFFDAIAERLIGILENRATEVESVKELQVTLIQQKEQIKEKAEYAGYLTRLFFDAELFVIGES